MQINKKRFDNFIKQPALGFDEHSRGRSAAQLKAFEKKIGFSLPDNYIEIMKLQNGGAVSHSKIAGVEDFDFKDGFRPIRPDLDDFIDNFRDYILLTCDDEQLQVATQLLKPFHPERLILFSDLHGHAAACFDYGYRLDKPLANPEVVFIDDDGDDFLHFREMGPRYANFDTFLDNLSADEGENEDALYLGVVCSSYDITLKSIAATLKINLESYENDDRYGHFNFKTWHSSHVPLYLDDATLKQHAQNNNSDFAELLAWTEDEGRIRHIYAIFSPNQHLAGTYLYPDNPDVNMVIEIKKSWFPMQKPVEALMAALKQITELNEVMFL